MQTLNLIEDINLAKKADVLLIQPPFTTMRIPSFGLHVLASFAKVAGFESEVFYGNLYFESLIGSEIRNKIIKDEDYFGERIFAAAAFGKEKLSDTREFEFYLKLKTMKMSLEELGFVESCVEKWVDSVVELIKVKEVKVLGLTSCHFQTTAALALINRVKKEMPQVVTLMGGPNCLGEMAYGIESIGESVDYIFSGESEVIYQKFLEDFKNGKLPPSKIIKGDPINELDKLPRPEYGDYYQQLKLFLPQVFSSGEFYISYETSRGCWWGAKKHCTFCGLSDEFMGHREKSEDKVVSELNELIKDGNTVKLLMTDNIMPYGYYNNLLPKLSEQDEKFAIFYELKANVDFKKVLMLLNAGVGSVQPGIEALNSTLLDRMDKGIRAYQNLLALKYFTTVGISLSWNMIFGFPGDTEEEYSGLVSMIPKITHLIAPERFGNLGINRFSPYFEKAKEYGIENIRYPKTSEYVYPENANHELLNYDFEGDYQSFSRKVPPLIKEIAIMVDEWQKDASSRLIITKDDKGYCLEDTRKIAKVNEVILDEKKLLALVKSSSSENLSEEQNWAIDNDYAMIIDERYIPLVCLSSELFSEFKDMY